MKPVANAATTANTLTKVATRLTNPELFFTAILERIAIAFVFGGVGMNRGVGSYRWGASGSLFSSVNSGQKSEIRS
jgi:hypothetical protein